MYYCTCDWAFWGLFIVLIAMLFFVVSLGLLFYVVSFGLLRSWVCFGVCFVWLSMFGFGGWGLLAWFECGLAGSVFFVEFGLG